MNFLNNVPVITYLSIRNLTKRSHLDGARSKLIMQDLTMIFDTHMQ